MTPQRKGGSQKGTPLLAVGLDGGTPNCRGLGRAAAPSTPVEMSLLNETGGGKSERLMRVRTHFVGVLSRIRTRKPRSKPQQARHHLERMRKVLCPVRGATGQGRFLCRPAGECQAEFMEPVANPRKGRHAIGSEAEGQRQVPLALCLHEDPTRRGSP